MSNHYRFRKGTEQDRNKSIERATLLNKAAAIARARAHSRTIDDFVEIYVNDADGNEQLAAVVHTEVIDGVNQFMGDGVYTFGSKVEL